jgi:hypothetical protein
MILLLCRKCGDLFRVFPGEEDSVCSCAETSGWLVSENLDGQLTPHYVGQGMLILIEDYEIDRAKNQPRQLVSSSYAWTIIDQPPDEVH